MQNHPFIDGLSRAWYALMASTVLLAAIALPATLLVATLLPHVRIEPEAAEIAFVALFTPLFVTCFAAAPRLRARFPLTR